MSVAKHKRQTGKGRSEQPWHRMEVGCMTIKINPKDLIKCFSCGISEEFNDDELFESITLNDGERNGTVTFFLCPGCRKKVLQNIIASEFRRRFIRNDEGKEWPKKGDEDESQC